ncbi:CRISPR-associated endonuclease/helicase Cas3 [Scopulibacillus daqui]|uniref:CRISPR-associated endonuclease/helicase Cas3 n=1 Tax=Scopulibacillus daqui TaxID=1469162 RepID=A0ABS2PY81_9BACL|nr:CRISPR-associated helicase Cas3' [Scopulibacillus daqui]MBM7644535.1 CRISPR-associated endonuclease/helicase Cas3 [Scopulibacillus daqui]
MDKLFENITGDTPYKFQRDVFEKLVHGESNLVITAPTGAGKTWMSVIPFIYAKQNRLEFADRMFYVLPQRTLVTAVANTIRPKLTEAKLEYKVTVQMGGENKDPYFEGDIIVTTIDQLLAAYIGLSYGTTRPLSNIPPGALLGSYIVVDEFHLLENGKALTTFIDLARRLSSFTKVCMMTATASTSYIKEIASKINAQDYEVSPKEIVSLQKNKKRNVTWVNSPITPESIKQSHKDRTLVVVNTVHRAQQLYKHLKELLENGEIELICLHARFLKEDRYEKEDRIRDIFKEGLEKGSEKDSKKGSKKQMIVIANQVVEVGLDISASVLITELCPANALIQRIGRCARFGEVEGKVFVHELEGKTTYPYTKDIVDKTREYLIKNTPIRTTAIEEAKMVQEIHEEVDRSIRFPIDKRKKEVEKSLSDGHVSNIRKLVREVNNVQIIIHEKPWEIDIFQKPQQFSIPISILKARLKDAPLSETVYYPYFSEETKYREQPEWRPIHQIDEIGEHLFLSLSSRIVTYSKEIGLVIGESGEFSSPYSAQSSAKKEPYSYTKESYVFHAESVRSLIRSQDQSYQVFTKKLAQELQTDSETINEFASLVGALHDVGKLREDIAYFYLTWQKEVIGEEANEYLAHTDYNPESSYHREQIKKYKKQQSHAPEGAYIAAPLIEQFMRNKFRLPEKYHSQIFRAVVEAIRKHHNAYVKKTQCYRLVSDAEKVVEKSLKEFNMKSIDLNLSLGPAKKVGVSKIKICPDEKLGWMIYWFIVRRLRIADQLSQKLKNERR